MATKTSILNKLTDGPTATTCQTESIVALVSDFGEHAENGWNALPGDFATEFPNTLAHLKTMAKDVRADEIVNLTTHLVSAGGTALLGQFIKMTTVAGAAGVTRRTGPTPEATARKIAARRAAARMILDSINKLIADADGITMEMVDQAATAGDDEYVGTVDKLVARADFLLKLGSGGGSGTKVAHNRQLSNVTDGTVVLFNGVSGLISGDKLVISGDVAGGEYGSPSTAAVAVRRAQGAKNPSVNGWKAWATADGVKLADLHDGAESNVYVGADEDGFEAEIDEEA